MVMKIWAMPCQRVSEIFDEDMEETRKEDIDDGQK
jgi:hypothetical protein